MNHLRSPGKVRVQATPHHGHCSRGRNREQCNSCRHVTALHLPEHLAVALIMQLSWLNSISAFVTGKDADEHGPSRLTNSKHLKKMVRVQQLGLSKHTWHDDWMRGSLGWGVGVHV